MIPSEDYEDYEDYDEELEEDFSNSGEQSSLTYKLDYVRMTISGTINDIEAIEQAVFKRLSTESGIYEIYDNYGVELEDLHGSSLHYAMAVISSRIEESLLRDDRLASVEVTSVEKIEKNALYVSITVTTQEGEELEIESEVDI